MFTGYVFYISSFGKIVPTTYELQINKQKYRFSAFYSLFLLFSSYSQSISSVAAYSYRIVCNWCSMYVVFNRILKSVQIQCAWSVCVCVCVYFLLMYETNKTGHKKQTQIHQMVKKVNSSNLYSLTVYKI